MDEVCQALVLDATGASSIEKVQNIQQLWSGYGQIFRARLRGGAHRSVVVKCVQPPEIESHPRGWTSAIAYQRKLKSYQVELHWYRHWSHQCSGAVARCYASHQQGNKIWLVLEDRTTAVTPVATIHCPWINVAPCCTGWRSSMPTF